MRIAALSAAVGLSLIGISAADTAKAAIRMDTRIPAEDLGAALRTLEHERKVTLIFLAEDVRNVHTQGARGQLTTDEVLQQVLSGTGLAYRHVDEATMSIFPAGSADRAQSAASEPAASSDSTSHSADQDSAKEGKRSSSGGFRVAQVGPGSAQGTDSVGATSSARSGAPVALEEIVVTAQKRAERLQDVPVPVSAISAQSLVNDNALRLADYYTRVPGLSVTPSDFGGAQLTIRGLTTGGFTNPTVGITVDDVPYGSSSGLGSGQEVPDFDPSDLARIEVLRGPQGTLYGASSIGGLLKYVTLDPSTDAYSGQIQAGTDWVHNGSDLGYNLRGSVNAPINDIMALRASGFVRRDAGYIDDPTFNQKAVNQAYLSGGHVAMLWKPAEDWSVKLSALLQRGWAGGSSLADVGPGIGDLQQVDAVGSGGYDKTFQSYSLTLKGKIGISELTAVSGYSINRSAESIDYTSILGGLTQNGLPGTGFNGFGVSGTPLFSYVTTRKFTHELRLQTPLGNRIDWLLGLFYNHEASDASEDILATDEATGQRAGQWLHVEDPSTFAEYAAFTDLTVRVTDQFDVQLGGRESQNRQAYRESFVGPYAALFLGASPFEYPRQHTKDNSFTYLVTPRLKLSPDLMLYARLASGYRPGGPNVNTGAAGLPTHYDPDTTRNYEIGIKGAIPSRVLSYDVSLYYIDWKNIQLQLIDLTKGGIEFFANGSRAKSEGIEGSIDAHPWAGLSITASAAWNHAVLTEPLPANESVGSSGDRLPYSSRLSGSLSFDQEFPLWNNLTGFAGATVGYTGDRLGVFPTILAGSSARQTLGAYAKTDLRTGITYDSWRVNVFVTNVTDKRGALSGGLNTTLPNAFSYIQPRTVGATVTKSF